MSIYNFSISSWVNPVYFMMISIGIPSIFICLAMSAFVFLASIFIPSVRPSARPSVPLNVPRLLLLQCYHVR